MLQLLHTVMTLVTHSSSLTPRVCVDNTLSLAQRKEAPKGLIADTETPFAQPCRSERPLNMENLPVNNGSGQSYGYTLYETRIGSTGGAFHSRNNIRDRAQVL